MSKTSKTANPLLEGDEPTPPQSVTGGTETKGAEAPKAAVEVLDNYSLTKKNLEAEPKVDFLVPVTPGESADIPEEVSINGVKIVVKKGVLQKIPISVATILAEKYRIQMDAGKSARIDRTPKVEDALS
jgi:hypothetical protein